MIIMTSLLKILCISIILAACCKQQLPTGNISNMVEMNISASKTTINSAEKTLLLFVVITNSSENDIFVLNFPDFSTDSSNVFEVVIEKDGKKKVSPTGLLKKRRIPRKSDYKKLKPGEMLSFRYPLDLALLANDEKHLGQMNTDFGIYKIRVVFVDHFIIVKKAVKHLKSNTIEVKYIL